MKSTSRTFLRQILALLTVVVLSCGLAAATPSIASASHTNQNICGYWVVGLIKHRYDQVPGTLGCPTSDELTNPGNTGKRQHFGPRGNIYWRNNDGFAYTIWGSIWSLYASRGYEAGVYQYPSANEGCCASDGVNSNFYYQYFANYCWILLWSPTVGFGANYRCA